MGTRNKDKTTTQTTENQGGFQSYDRTPEEEALANYSPDRTLLDAGTRATFGKTRQNITEGLQGITNPYARARAEQIALEELADQESSAMVAANQGLNELDLRNKQFLAGLRQPRYIQTGSKTVTTEPNQGGGFLNSLISGGLGLASAFA